MDITVEEFEKAPDYLNFYIFVNAMLMKGNAEFSEHNNKIINLNTSASNFFAIGRDQNMKPFIGVQEDMMDWFFSLDWAEIAYMINRQDVRIYLVSKDEKNKINFILGIRVKRKRIVVLHDEKNEDIEKSFCNMKVIKEDENGDMLMSYNNLISNLGMRKIKKLDELIDEQIDDKIDSEKMKLMFVKNKNKK